MEDFVINFLRELSVFNFNFIVLASPKGRGFRFVVEFFFLKYLSKRSKFIMNISDEMYVDNKNWDTKLEKYANFYSDNIFRLRTSVYKTETILIYMSVVMPLIQPQSTQESI